MGKPQPLVGQAQALAGQRWDQQAEAHENRRRQSRRPGQVHPGIEKRKIGRIGQDRQQRVGKDKDDGGNARNPVDAHHRPWANCPRDPLEAPVRRKLSEHQRHRYGKLNGGSAKRSRIDEISQRDRDGEKGGD